MSLQIPRPEYPRPDFARENWQNLNGNWEFAFDKENKLEQEGDFLASAYDKEISVPFCYQSKLSGIHDETDYPACWYKRRFDCRLDQGRVLLKFGGVDEIAKVWVNQQYVGMHKGGYSAFAFDITPFVKEKDNEIIVKAEDGQNSDKPRGKQSWTGEKFGCWYTPVTGIWQSVWLEYAGDTYFTKIKITPDVDNLQALCEVFLSGQEDTRVTLTMDVSFAGTSEDKVSTTFQAKKGYGKAVFSFRDLDVRDNNLFWTPENPNLIPVKAETNDLPFNDTVETYFGMRKISIQNGKILLNNHSYFQRLILDQGYWTDSLLTPPSDQAIIDDIKLTKEMGFNGARKHQKIEDPRYYYWADKLGLIVWGEMPSAYEFNDNAIESTTNELISFIDRDYNHPSIVTWVTINESWGVRYVLSNSQQQNYTRMLYYLVKSLDPSRLVSSNDGWEQVDANDICAIHDYAIFPDNLDKYDDLTKLTDGFSMKRLSYAQGSSYTDKPFILTEYGGIAFSDTDEESWGYFGKVANQDEFVKRLEPVTAMLANTRKFSGYCYTQLTDVMQEVNGLLTEDRKPKIPIDVLNKIFSMELV